MFKKIILSIVVIMCAVLVVVLFTSPGINKAGGDESSISEPGPTVPAPTQTPPPTPEPTPEPTVYLEPSEARITVGGDIVVHMGINEQALSDGGDTYDYTAMFDDVKHYIEDADYASCCLETTFLDGTCSGYPMFRSPDQLAYDLKNVGFDLIATASNHCLDSWKRGLDRTLDVLDDAGLDHVGTYRTQEERDANDGILVKEINGISIAFLDFTYGTNGLPKEEYPYAVNVYYTDYMTNFNCLDYDMVDADMAAARALNTDIIAVIVHWGIEYRTTPVTAQTDFADYLFRQGADLVLGGHPHVPESMERRTITNEDGTTHDGFVCYCLSNLLSCMNDDYTYLTALLQIDLVKDNNTGETVIKDVGYVPVVLVDAYDYGVYNAGWRYRLWDLYSAVDDYEAGNNRGVMTENMYNRFKGFIADFQNICGADYDLIARERNS